MNRKSLSFIIICLFTILMGCNDDCEVPPTVEFEGAEVSISERSSQEITLMFSETPKPTDEFIISITRVGASESDYTLSEIVTQDEFILTGEDHTFEVSSVFDSQAEPDEALVLTVKSGEGNFTVGSSPVLIVKLINYNIGNNLVGEYLFNGDALDTSPDFENNGTIFGATAATDRNGNTGATLSFDGNNDYVSIPDNSATDFNSVGDFTISIWVSASASQSPNNLSFNDILRKWVGDSQPYPFSISYCSSDHPTNPNQILAANFDGSGCGNSTTAFSNAISESAFHHIVVVKSGTKLIQYIDNVKVSEVTSNVSCSTSNNTHITVGSRGQLVRFFTGKIDDLRFYNVAITQTLVSELFNETAIH